MTKKYFSEMEIFLAEFIDLKDADEELAGELLKNGFTKRGVYWEGETDLVASDLELFVRDSIFPLLEQSSQQTVHVRNVREI